MFTIEQDFRFVEKTLLDLEAAVEGWQVDHQCATLAGDFEEQIEGWLATWDKRFQALVRIREALQALVRIQEDFPQVELDFDRAIREFFSRLESRRLEETSKLLESFEGQVWEVCCKFEQIGYSINQANLMRDRIRQTIRIYQEIIQIVKDQDHRSHSDPPEATGVGPSSFDLPLHGPRTRTRSDPPRLPDEPSSTEEQSFPMDLPRLGPRMAVKARPVPVRLPDPIDD